MNKKQVLEEIFKKINEAQSFLVIDSGHSVEDNAFVDDSYRILEVAKLALRGAYHTEK